MEDVLVETMDAGVGHNFSNSVSATFVEPGDVSDMYDCPCIYKSQILDSV